MQRVLKIVSALENKEIPVAAIIVKNGEIIASATNQKEAQNDVTAHAEILAIKAAAERLGNWRLDGCELYVNLEPCPMCGWVIIQSGIKTLYFGAYNYQYGSMGSVLNLPKLANSKIKVFGGINEKICTTMLEDFFKGIR